MPRTKQTTVYTYDELSDKAKERARDWYREGNLDYDWWDSVYEDAATRGQELGINLRQKTVKLMRGGTKHDPEIYFEGFYHQGQGSSYCATWRMSDLQLDVLRKKIGTKSENDKTLRQIADVLEKHATRYPNATAQVVSTRRSDSVNVEVELGDRNIDNDFEFSAPLNDLEYGSPEYRALKSEENEVRTDIEEALSDFNHWIFRQLQLEYDWLNSDKQIEESIRANEYEFNEDGSVA